MRRVAKRLLVSLLAVLITFALVETALRLVPFEERSFRSTALDPTASRFGHDYRFRETGVERQKPVGTFRVLVLGDSFTWGGGVLGGDAYPARLERLLRLEWPQRNFQVLNAGRRGWNTVDVLKAHYRDNLLDTYAPDLAILGYCLNDAEPTSRRRRLSLRRPMERRLPEGPVSSRLYARSLLYRLVFDRLENTRQRRAVTGYYRGLFQEHGKPWQEAVAALGQLRDLLAERSVPFLVVVFPIFDSQFDESYPYRDLHEKVVRTCRDLGIEVVDLLPDYEGIDARRLAVEPFTNAHPNELAHRIAAQRLFEHLRGRLDAVQNTALASRAGQTGEHTVSRSDPAPRAP